VKLNWFEDAVINSPPRRWLQRWYETPLLKRLGGPLPRGARALEIGCGPGYGSRLILERFGAARVDACDLDPRQLGRARRRLSGLRDRVRLGLADATDLGAFSGGTAYDAVFDFGIVHHVPDWRDAVAEVGRVLRPGGVFYFEEVTKHALDRPAYRLLTDHPRHDRFTGTGFVEELNRHGLTVQDHRTLFFGDFVVGAAVREG
jgi:SAM-dependent methyltransferase